MNGKKKAGEAGAQEPVTDEIREDTQARSEAPEQPERENTEPPAGDDCAAKLAEAERKRDEYLDSLRRSQADFINYKRHNERARSDGYEDGNREAIAAILPVIDNLERAIEAAEKAQEIGALVDGVRMTHKAMMEALARRGLEEIPAMGQPFDPELHNAVARGEGEGEPGTILEVYQKGYRVKGKIVRYAMVKVLSE